MNTKIRDKTESSPSKYPCLMVLKTDKNMIVMVMEHGRSYRTTELTRAPGTGYDYTEEQLLNSYEFFTGELVLSN